MDDHTDDLIGRFTQSSFTAARGSFTLLPPEPVIVTHVHAELAAMQRIADAMAEVGPDAQDRIAGWVFDRWRQKIEED